MTQFDTESSTRRDADGHWSGHVSGAWSIGENPNGGYLTSLALSAVLDAVPHPDPISLTTHFLRPGIAEAPCRVRVEVIRSGRTLSTVRATLLQEDKPRIEVLAALSDLDRPAGVDTELTLPAPALPAPEVCVPRSGAMQNLHLPILERLSVLLHPDLAVPGSADRAEMSGWIGFADGRAPDARALALFTDAFPPSPLSLLGVIGWVPTLELTVHVRRRPAPGWIRARFVTDDLHEGRMIETGALWDSNGALVAQSRQIGLVTASGGDRS
ncbi:MAG: thioesterase family protein [Pseudomonadales bacterium]